jgi:hypothetical protein
MGVECSNLCVKTTGCGGHAINIAANHDTLKIVQGQELLKSYQAKANQTESGKAADSSKKSENVRWFCSNCASYLYIVNDNYLRA